MNQPMDPFIADYIRLRDDALGLLTARGAVHSSSWGITSDGRPSLQLTLSAVDDMEGAIKRIRVHLRDQGFNITAFCGDRTIHVSLPIAPRTPPVLRIAGQGVPLAGVRRLSIDYGPLGFVDLTGDQAREAITAIRSGWEIHQKTEPAPMAVVNAPASTTDLAMVEIRSCVAAGRYGDGIRALRTLRGVVATHGARYDAVRAAIAVLDDAAYGAATPSDVDASLKALEAVL